MDEQYKTVEEALESFANEKKSEEVKNFWEGKNLDQKLSILDKKRKIVEVEGVVDFLQTGNERLNDTSKMVHKPQLNFLERDEAKKSRNEEVEDANKNESATDNKPYFLRKRRNIDYNEQRMSKKQEQDGSISPSLNSQIFTSLSEEDNSFFEEEIVIDDVPSEFSFKNGDPENDIYMEETNVSLLFRNYQNMSLDLAKTKGLLVESNVQEILSLSSILLLA